MSSEDHTENTKRFYGREWVFTKLHHYLQSDRRSAKAPTGVLITGGLGSGKTAVCRELASPSTTGSTTASTVVSELHSRLAAVHLCRRSDAASLEAATFIRSIAAQIARCPLVSEQYASRLRTDVAISGWLETPRCQSSPKEAATHAVCQPLNAVPEPSANLFILIDSIHDAGSGASDGTRDGDADGDVSLAELVAHLIAGLPKWLLVVCTARGQRGGGGRGGRRGVMQHLVGFRKLTLDDLRRTHVVADVQRYILGRLDDEPCLRRQLDAETAEMLNQLHVKSAGCLLYLELVLDGVRDGFIRLREIRHIPGTLNGLYLWLCQRVFGNNGSDFARARPILELLLASRQPLTKAQIYTAARCRCLEMSEDEFEGLLALLVNVIAVRNGFLVIFHPSFEEWLLDVKHCTKRYLCSPANGHGSLAMYYASKGADLSPTEIVYFAFHLTRSSLARDLSSHQLACVLLQSGAQVQDLVLNCPVLDEATTRLLLESVAESETKPANHVVGADFVHLGRAADGLDAIAEEEETQATLFDDGVGDRTGSNPTREAYSVSPPTGVLPDRLTGASDEDGNEDPPLIAASKSGNIELIVKLLDSGEDVNQFGPDGWTPLRSAAWGGHINCVEKLIEKGAIIDHSADETRRTALRAAAWSGHTDIVAILIAHGAEVDLLDNDGRTALMAAAYMGHSTIVEQLVVFGADPDVRDADGRTALHVTAVCAAASSATGGHADQHLAVAEALLRSGAKVDQQGRTGRSALYLAALEGHLAMCQLLIDRGADVDLADSTQTSPLLAAASNGHCRLVSRLLECGADSDTIDEEGRTVLTVAASQGDPSVVGHLLAMGLDELHRDHYGWLPIHHAAFEGRPEACRLLARCNAASLRHTDHEGRHPLLLAAEEGHVDCCRVLLDEGAAIDAGNLEGRTALRLAACAVTTSSSVGGDGCLSTAGVVEMLIERGADVEAVDVDGHTVLYALVLAGGAGGSGGSGSDLLEMTERLLTCGKGARTDCADRHGRTPLHVAAWHTEAVNLCQLLLRYGASIDVRDSEGRTPLMTALWRGNLPTAQFLLQRGADPNTICQQGASCLGIVAQEGNLDACKLLLRYGANPDHKDDYGRSPKDVAMKLGNSQLVTLLNKVNTLSPMLRRRDINGSSPISNNTSSSQNSTDEKAKMTNTSGYNSVGLTTSSESPNFNTSRADYNGNQFHKGAHVSHNAPTIGSTKSSYISGHSSNKSTLSTTSDYDRESALPSSAGDESTNQRRASSTAETFARKLLERSLPRRNSHLFPQNFTVPSPPAMSPEDVTPFSPNDSNCSSSSTLQKRSQIVTNPKIRKPCGVVLSPDGERRSIAASLTSSQRESRL